MLLHRRDSLLLREDDGDVNVDYERSSNLPRLGSLFGGTRQPCPVTSDTATIHFITAVTRLLIELGRLHHGIVSKVEMFFFISYLLGGS